MKTPTERNLEAMQACYLAGFKASAEGHNGECMFINGKFRNDPNPVEDKQWVKDCDAMVTNIFGTMVLSSTPSELDETFALLEDDE